MLGIPMPARGYILSPENRTKVLETVDAIGIPDIEAYCNQMQAILDAREEEETKTQVIAMNDNSVTTTSDVKTILYPAAESPEYDISVKIVMQTTSYGIQPENANWWVRIELVRY